MARTVTRTAYYAKVIPEDAAAVAYELLRTTVVWKVGITSRSGDVTRCQSQVDEISLPIVMPLLIVATAAIGKSVDDVKGIYLNYYRDEQDYTPSHSHKGSVQLVISLGATRDLVVGKKSYSLDNGDVIVFGSSAHSVPKSVAASAGRISIACFL